MSQTICSFSHFSLSKEKKEEKNRNNCGYSIHYNSDYLYLLRSISFILGDENCSIYNKRKITFTAKKVQTLEIYLMEREKKTSKASYSRKDYTFPSGKIIKVQGYEPHALDELVKTINEDEIKTGSINVPEIWYNDEKCKEHRYYVDIFIPSQNKCIEVKSTWTAKKKKDNIFLKQNAAKKLGYNYEIWVYDSKGIRVEKYE